MNYLLEYYSNIRNPEKKKKIKPKISDMSINILSYFPKKHYVVDWNYLTETHLMIIGNNFTEK